MFKYFIIYLSFLLVSCTSENPICNSNTAIGDINGVEFSLEVACSEDDKRQGLMYRNTLARDSGMIFVYDKADYYAFWMKNTNIPLSIAFLDENKKIVDIFDMKPHDLTPMATKEKAIYVIEMNLGWFDDNKIRIGDQLKFIKA